MGLPEDLKDYGEERPGMFIFTADEAVAILAIVGFAAFSLYELQRLAAWMFAS